MSDNIWSFYEFSQLMESNFRISRKRVKPTTDGKTEAPPTAVPESPPATPAAVSAPEAPQSSFVPKRSVVNTSSDPLEKLGGRATKTIAKGRERQVADEMSDQEAAAKIKAAAKISPFDAISTLNDVNGNWNVGYWVTTDILKKLGYNVPEIPMDDHPRWVPTSDGGFQRGYWRGEDSDGSKDGPYVTINGQGPYSVKVEDPRHIRKILRAVFDKVGGGESIESEDGLAHQRTSKLRDIGFNDMDLKAGREGEEKDRASQMRGKIIAKQLGGKPGLNSYQTNKEIGGKSVGNHSLRSAPEKKEAPEMKSGPSEGEARKIEQELSKHLETLNKLSDPSIAGEDSETWAKEAEKFKHGPEIFLNTKPLNLKAQTFGMNLNL